MIHTDECNDEEEEDDPDQNIIQKLRGQPRQPFLYVHQRYWQKKIASEICLLDATYRTTQYALPLFMLCVPTNVNYITVATFVTETEDSNSITEDIQIIVRWGEFGCLTSHPRGVSRECVLRIPSPREDAGGPPYPQPACRKRRLKGRHYIAIVADTA